MDITTIIKARTKNQLLTIAERPLIASGDANTVLVCFVFDPAWDAFTIKYACFHKANTPHIVYKMLISDDGYATVPHEVLNEAGDIFFGVKGYIPDYPEVIKTSLNVKYNILVGTTPSSSAPPTPDEFEQMMSEVGRIKQNVSDEMAEMNDTMQEFAENDEARTAAETVREANEDARKAGETVRIGAESTRNTNEAARSAAESNRVTAESGRASAENIRNTNETARSTAESGRAAAEGNRESAETTRSSNETSRIEAESRRASAESARVSAENSRSSSESARRSAESGRLNAESIRASAENVRNANEQTRVSTEAERVAAESSRAEEFAAWGSTIAGVSQYDSRIDKNYKLIANLVQGMTFPSEIDSSDSYTKTVPANALPYAEVLEVGGMTEKPQKQILTTIYSAASPDGTDLDVPTTTLPLVVKVKAKSSAAQTLQLNMNASMWVFEFSVPADNEWHEYSTRIEKDHYAWGQGGWMEGQPIQGTVYLYDSSYLPAMNAEAKDLTFSTEELVAGDTLAHTKVTAIESKYGSSVHRLPIPAAVQALDGYGIGGVLERYYGGSVGVPLMNYISWESKKFVEPIRRVVFDGSEEWKVGNNQYGTLYSTKLPEESAYWQYGCLAGLDGECEEIPQHEMSYNMDSEYFYVLSSKSLDDFIAFIAAKPVEVVYPRYTKVMRDISAILPDDNLIKVTGGGTITAVNEQHLNVSTTIKFQLKGDTA